MLVTVYEDIGIGSAGSITGNIGSRTQGPLRSVFHHIGPETQQLFKPFAGETHTLEAPFRPETESILRQMSGTVDQIGDLATEQFFRTDFTHTVFGDEKDDRILFEKSHNESNSKKI